MPSADVGAEVLRNRALNCWPWVRSLVHSPAAVIHSPGDHGGVANDGNEIAVTSCLDPNDAKTVVGILVSDALNQPGQHLPIGWLRFRFHDVLP